MKIIQTTPGIAGTGTEDVMSQFKAVEAYFKAMEEEYGDIPVSHEEPGGGSANYFYWHNDDVQGPLSQLCFIVGPQWLYDKGILTWDEESQSWDLEGTKIPENFDFKKIRRRLEDALRKTSDEGLLLRLALNLNVKID